MTAGDPTFETIRGHYAGRGVTCPQFRLETGETISLAGINNDTLADGVLLIVTGNWQRVSTCMQGRAFRVERIETGG